MADFQDAANLKFFGTLELVAAGEGKLPVEISLEEVKRIVLNNTGLTKVFYRAKERKIGIVGDDWAKTEDLVVEAQDQGEVLAILRVWQGK